MIYTKPKIFAWCDTPTVPTGFGIVTKNLLRDIHKKYDLDILGINYHGDTKYDTNKWFIYPAMQYPDFLGLKKMKKLLLETKPDIVFLFQDIFHINDAWGIIEEGAPNAKKVIYFPIDGTPVNISWKTPLVKADVVITYSQFAKQAILDTYPKLDPDKILTLDHGIDTDIFKPLSAEYIKDIRKSLKWDKKFVMLNINRFQPRKVIPLTLRAGALFSKGYHKCKCGNWYLKERRACDLNGCGPKDIIETVQGRRDTLLYLHMLPQEQGMGPGHSNSLQAHAYNAGYRNEDLSGPKQTLQINAQDLYRDPLPEEKLNNVYNASCINISTTVGEGFGFSLAESAASGTLSIAPNHSAIPEVLGDTGYLCKNIGHYNMAMDNGHVRPIVDVRDILEALELEYKKWLSNGREPVKSKYAIERVKKVFNWDDKRKFIEDVFAKVLEDQDEFLEAEGGSFVLTAPKLETEELV